MPGIGHNPAYVIRRWPRRTLTPVCSCQRTVPMHKPSSLAPYSPAPLIAAIRRQIFLCLQSKMTNPQSIEWTNPTLVCLHEPGQAPTRALRSSSSSCQDVLSTLLLSNLCSRSGRHKANWSQVLRPRVSLLDLISTPIVQQCRHQEQAWVSQMHVMPIT